MSKAAELHFSIIDVVARTCHEVNRAYCAAIGDTSQVPWDSAPKWQRESVLAGIEFHVRNPGAAASASHDNWMNEKLRAGWRYGATKDEMEKTHPCLVPFEQLPPEQQIKDHLFKAVVRGTLG